MNIPLLDLRTQNGALEPELREAFLRVLRSSHFILGAEVEKFERALAESTGARFALGVSSGTDALLLALMALGIGPGDEVICPTFTFFATAGCIARLGATPVFVDSCEDTFNLDPAEVARKITPRTKAIMPVHLFGRMAEMDGLMELARRQNLRVIEDGAQAFGATQKNRQAGTLGDFGAISFFPSKNLGAFGDAGALFTNDEEFFRRARVLRVHGMEPKYHHAVIGGNFRIDALQAALLAVKLPHLSAYAARRRQNAALYREKLGALPEGSMILPEADGGHVWNQFTVRVPGRRDALRERLTARGIGSEIYYPVPLHEQVCFAYLGHGPGDFPVAHRLAGEVLSLPVFPELEEGAIDEVCRTIGEFFGGV